MHTIIRQPKHKFGPALEVRQVRVFVARGRSSTTVAGLVSTPPSSSDSKDKMRRPTSAGSALGRPSTVVEDF
eukprot:4925023-Prymnesium_polylepis.1